NKFKIGHILGHHALMEEVFRVIRKVAPSQTTVLITGESGTGKELVARALHAESSRKERPFRALNCAAIPETLMESELFGYEKGAFTGAQGRQTGGGDQAGHVSGRFVLSPECRVGSPAAASGPGDGHPGARRSFP